MLFLVSDLWDYFLRTVSLVVPFSFYLGRHLDRQVEEEFLTVKYHSSFSRYKPLL